MLMPPSEGERHETHSWALSPLSHRPGHEGWQDHSAHLQHDLGRKDGRRRRSEEERMAGGSDRADMPGNRPVADSDRTSRPAWVRMAPFLGRPPALTHRQWRGRGGRAGGPVFFMYYLSLFFFPPPHKHTGFALPCASP